MTTECRITYAQKGKVLEDSSAPIPALGYGASKREERKYEKPVA